MDDNISRQQAIDALRDYLVGKNVPCDGTLTCRLIENEVINKLPSTQFGTNMAEVGTDSISRQKAIETIDDLYVGETPFAVTYNEINTAFKALVRMLPSEQPYTISPDGRLWIMVDDIDEVRAVVVGEHKSKFCKQFYEDAQPEMGRWIHHPEIGWGETWLCDQCGEKTTSTVMGKPRWNFCPNCGAKMGE